MTARVRPGLVVSATALVQRDLRVLWRRRSDALQPALFAVLVVVLFALALGAEEKLLPKVASAVLWLAVLLAGQLSLDSLFRSDAEDGCAGDRDDRNHTAPIGGDDPGLARPCRGPGEGGLGGRLMEHALPHTGRGR